MIWIQVSINLTFYYAVITHYGKSVTEGHYRCDVRESDGSWMHFDDGSVYSVESREVMQRSAYLLFYIRDPSA